MMKDDDTESFFSPLSPHPPPLCVVFSAAFFDLPVKKRRTTACGLLLPLLSCPYHVHDVVITITIIIIIS